MNVVDISLLVLLGGFALYGLWFGIIHMIGTLIGLIFGAIVAGRAYVPFAAWLAPHVGGNENLAKVIGFFVLFVLVTKLVGLESQKAILNVARMGYFSSDRAVREYCEDIWQARPVPIEIGLEAATDVRAVRAR